MTSLVTIVAFSVIWILNWTLGGLLSLHVPTSRICRLKDVGDEEWYPRYHPAWTQKAQGGVYHSEDFRGP
jgi:hypothetical protein